MTYVSDDPADQVLPPDVHLVVDDEVVGPLDEAGICALVAEGRVTAATLAWHPALDGWASLDSMPELSWLLEPRPEPAQPPQPLQPPQPMLEPATLGRRVAAGMADFVFWLVLSVAVGIFVGVGLNWIEGADHPIFSPRFDVLAQMAAALYFIVPMSRVGGGQTPGYWLLGLRLVDRAQLRPPSVLRALVWYAVSFARLVGWLTYFIDLQHRMLHDLASGTLVIVDRGRAP